MAGPTKVLFEAEFDGSGAVQGLRKVETQLDSVEKQAEETSKSTKLLDTTWSTFSKNIAAYAGAFLTLSKVADLAAQGLRDAMAEERSMNQLSAAVAAMGGNAELAAKQTMILATSLQFKGVMDDGQAIEMVKNFTLTLRDAEKALQATKLVGDLAASGIADVGTAQADVNKLLTEGAPRLKELAIRYGLSAEAAKDKQKALDELIKRYGGQAQALDDNISRMAAFKQVVDELAQGLGQSLVGTINALMPILKGLASVFVIVSGAVEAAVTLVSRLIQAFGQLGKINLAALMKGDFQAFTKSIKDAWTGIKEIGSSTLDDLKDITESKLALIEGLWDGYADGAVGNLKGLVAGAGEAGKKAGELAASEFVKGLESIKLKSYSALSLNPADFIDMKAWKSAGTKVYTSILEGQKEAVKTDKSGVKQYSELFAESFADGFIGWMNGDDFGDSWKGLWSSLAAGASSILGETFSKLFSGDKAGLKAMWTKEGGGFNWGQAAGVGGSLLMDYNLRQKNPSKGLGALAGAASGFAAGASFGPWGMVVGAILGAVMGYFGAQGSSKHGYSFGFSGTRGRVGEVSGGITKEQEMEAQRTMTAVYRATAFSFRDILKQLGVEPGALKEVNIGTRSGKAADPMQVIQQFIKGELPRAVFAVYKDTLTEALTNFTVGDKFSVSLAKANELMGNFTDLPFDQAMQALQNYVGALVALDSVYDDLSKSLEEMKAEIGASMRDVWLRSVEDTLAGIRDLSENLDQLTTDEQVARARQIADLAAEQYQANLQYLQQLMQMQDGMNRSFDEMFLGFREEEARANGTLPQFQLEQFRRLMGQLPQAQSAEQLQQIISDLMRYGQSFWNNPDVAPQWRQWIEEQLRIAQDTSNQMLDAWQQEVVDQNESLRNSIDGIIGALTGEAELRGALNDNLEEEGALLDENNLRLRDEISYRTALNEMLNQEASAHNTLIDTLYLLADAAAAASTGLGGAAPTTRAA